MEIAVGHHQPLFCGPVQVSLCDCEGCVGSIKCVYWVEVWVWLWGVGDKVQSK